MSNLPDRPITGSYWVRPGHLLAGPYPGSWDEDTTRDMLDRLLAAGVTAFVDLTQPGEREDYAPLLAATCDYQRFPIPDMGTPNTAQMVRILDAIDAALDAGRTVYVHCWGGIGRTGTAVGCFLVRHGLTGQEALDTIARLLHSGSPETAAQRLMILTWRQGD